MLLWIACALLTAAVLAALLRPLWRVRDRDSGPADAAGLAVYRDQLAEVDADLARGVIDAADAEAASREVSRRLIAHADRAHADSAASPSAARSLSESHGQSLALFIAALVPVSTLGLYLMLGSPRMPSSPHAVVAAAALPDAGIANLIEKVEARLSQQPGDGQGWDVIAPVYFKLERYHEAANAFAQAAKLLGESSKRLAGFAEASVLAANGIVGEEARIAYEKILVLEPSRVEPRFWLALAKEQDGNFAEALAGYRALLGGAAPGVQWRSTVEERIAIIERRIDTRAPATAAGPSADDVTAAAGMTAADRDAMIDQMVAGLADRLQKNGRDAAGWQRLVQAYVVLGRREAAVKALGQARSSLSGDDAALAALAELAKSLGLGS